MSRRSGGPIRVGHVLTNLWDGGIEKVVFTLCTRLPRDQFDLRVYTLIENNPWLSEFQAHGVPVRVLRGVNALGPRAVIPNARTVWQLGRALRADGIEIVNTHDFFPAVLGRVASFLAGTPRRVTTLHNTYLWFNRFHHGVNRLLGRWTDSVVAVSRPALEYSVEHEGLPRNKYALIPNGVDEASYLPDPSARAAYLHELGLPEDAFVIGNIGTISVRKGQKYLVQAAAGPMREDGRIHVVIVGSPRPHEKHIHDELLRMVEEHGLGGRVHFLRDRKDMAALYNLFDVFCMPSIAEGLSLASIEALMAERLVVYSDIGPLREVVEDGETGFLFRSEDAADLERVLRLAIDHRRRGDGAMEGRARRWATEHFGLMTMLNSYADLYRGLAISPVSKRLEPT